MNGDELILVSPAEPKTLWKLGDVDPLPEEFGVDFMWASPLGKVGVQRKQFPGDFLASVHDGRLNTEYLQMQALDVRVLLIEGEGKWSMDGELIESWGAHDRQRQRRWNRTTHRNYLSSVQIFKGVTVQHSKGLQDTERFIKDFFIWSQKADHIGLDARPAAQAMGYWANISNEDYQRYLLQSLPIIGPKLAQAILDHLGQIFTINVTYEQLLEVPGIGPSRATRIMDVFKKVR